VADNDLALGRIAAFLTKTLIWKDFALFVTEDDAQGGVDHVVKPGSVGHEHTSMGSITRTIDELVGLGPPNLEDALAGDIAGIWDDHPHLDPFAFVPSDPRVFAPPKRDSPSRGRRERRLHCATSMTRSKFASRSRSLRTNSAAPSRRTSRSQAAHLSWRADPQR
jgi:hypothetical protein